jgi:predicted acylesterase/phospholipase RssA
LSSRVNRALIFQGGGSLGAYEAGAYKAIKELSQYNKAKRIGKEPMFHIVTGTSIGAVNAAILVSIVKENKTWEGSDERLIECCMIHPRIYNTYSTLETDSTMHKNEENFDYYRFNSLTPLIIFE